MEQSWSVKELSDHVAESVRRARESTVPFYHLQFDRVFPPDFYGEMLRTMPNDNDDRPMSGKSKIGSSRPDGKPTRTVRNRGRRIGNFLLNELRNLKRS